MSTFILGAITIAKATTPPSFYASSFGAGTLGSVKSMTCDGRLCHITANTQGRAGDVSIRLAFHSPTIVRWWLALDGNFSNNGAADDVIVGHKQPVAIMPLADKGSFYEVTATGTGQGDPVTSARVQKSSCLLSVVVDGETVFSEASPLAWNASSSWQTRTPPAPLPTLAGTRHCVASQLSARAPRRSAPRRGASTRQPDQGMVFWRRHAKWKPI